MLPGREQPAAPCPVLLRVRCLLPGKAPATAFGQRDVRWGDEGLPVSSRINDICVFIPWFKHFDKPVLDKYAQAFRKVIENADQITCFNPFIISQ